MDSKEKEIIYFSNLLIDDFDPALNNLGKKEPGKTMAKKKNRKKSAVEQNKQPATEKIETQINQIQEHNNQTRQKMNSVKDKDQEAVLELEEASNLTVGEVNEITEQLEKENHPKQALKSEVAKDKVEPVEKIVEDTSKSEEDSPLDQYIKRHRSEIEEAKSKSIDGYVKKEAASFEADEANFKAQLDREALKKKIANMQTVPLEKLVDTTSELKEEEVQTLDQAPVQEAIKPEVSENPTTEKVNEFDPILVDIEEDKDKEEFPELSTKKVDSFETEKTVPTEPLIPLGNKTEPESTDLDNEWVDVQAPVAAELTRSAKSETKSKKVPIIIGAAAVLLIAAAVGSYQLYQSNQPKAPLTVASSSKSSSSASKSYASFTKSYAAFFTDSEQTMLKNANFSKLTDLEKELKAISNKSEKSKAQSKYDDLKAMIEAIGTVNNLFTKPAIIDGKLQSDIKIVENVKIPDAPKTANDKLNELLKQAINLAKTQAAKTTEISSVANVSTSQAAAGSQSTEQAASTTSQAPATNEANSAATSPAAQTPAPAANAATGGAYNPTGAAVDNSNARIQPQAGLDTSSSAFVWQADLNRILNTARERGYFTGDNYILLPVAIHTTKALTAGGYSYPGGVVAGYYNLYKADGTYLFTINCKTGYWFGNGKGLPLDY